MDFALPLVCCTVGANGVLKVLQLVHNLSYIELLILCVRMLEVSDVGCSHCNLCASLMHGSEHLLRWGSKDLWCMYPNNNCP